MNPIGFYRDDSGELNVQGIKIDDLAEKYGTPLFIYDTGLMKERFEVFLNTVNIVKGNIHYAVKANDSVNIIKFFGKLGAGADIVSIGEFHKCVAAGIAPNKIIFSGVGKDKNEIEIAIRNNILQFNIESEEELYDIYEVASKLKIKTNICLRINPDIAPNTHKKISTGEKETKFGIDNEDIDSIYKKLHELDHINPVGLGVHIGSQIFDFSFFKKAYLNLKSIADNLKTNGYKVPTLDLGGGIGIHYDSNKKPDFIAYKKVISDIFLKSDYQLSFEPGRILIAEAGVLITKVIRNKKNKEKKFVVIDAAMNNLIRPTLYDAYHKIEPVKSTKGRLTAVDIVGPICETGDFLALNRELVEVKSDDLLIIRTTGAYASVMKSNYNARVDAVEILIHNGKSYKIKQTDSIQDTILKEKIIDFHY